MTLHLRYFTKFDILFKVLGIAGQVRATLDMFISEYSNPLFDPTGAEQRSL